MEGRIDDGELVALFLEHFRLDAQGADILHVVVVDFLVADDLEQAALEGFFLIHADRVGVGQGLDIGSHSIGCFRSELSAVIPVHFVTVVLGRIVAGRDHDAAGCVEMADGIGQNRNGTKGIKQEGRNTVGAQHERCILGKLGGETAAVIGNHNTALCILRILHQVLGQTLGCTTHVVFVHTVGAGTQNAAHTGRAEGQTRVETVLDLSFIAGDRLEVFYGFRIIGKIRKPLFISLLDIHHRKKLPSNLSI